MQGFKCDLMKFRRQILIRKTKENNMILLKNNQISYLKNPYESTNSVDTILNAPIEDGIFYVEGIAFGVMQCSNGKAKNIEGYQVESFKMGGPILIPHTHKLLNLVVKQGFSKPGMQSLIVQYLKVGIKSSPLITGPL